MFSKVRAGVLVVAALFEIAAQAQSVDSGQMRDAIRSVDHCDSLVMVRCGPVTPESRPPAPGQAARPDDPAGPAPRRELDARRTYDTGRQRPGDAIEITAERPHHPEDQRWQRLDQALEQSAYPSCSGTDSMSKADLPLLARLVSSLMFNIPTWIYVKATGRCR